jgi:hypothetical protein
MPGTRSADATSGGNLESSFETWLDDYSLLKILVMRIVRQRLGRGSAMGDAALREAMVALGKAAERFGDAALEEDAEVDAGREEMEEEATEIVLRWLGTLSQTPALFQMLSETEQAAATWSVEEVTGFLYDTIAEMPAVPDSRSQLKRVRVVEVEDTDAKDGDAEAGEESSDDDERAARPKAGPPAKRVRVAGSGTEAGPLAAKKVCRSPFAFTFANFVQCERCLAKGLECRVQVARRGTSACVACKVAKAACHGMVVTGRVASAAVDGSSVLVQELRDLKADVLASLFSLGTIQLAAVAPTLVTLAKAAEALEQMRLRANEALDAKRASEEDDAADESEIPGAESESEEEVKVGENAGSSAEESSSSDEEEDESSSSEEDIEMSAA